MSTLSLNDVFLFEVLSKRNSNKAKIYIGALLNIAADVDVLLQYIKKEFPDYPDHSLQHSLRILQYVSKILDKNTCNRMTDTEIFCFIMACLFHDTGMSMFYHNDKNQTRNKHHEFSSYIVEKYIDDNLKFIFSSRLKTIISFVCRSHGMDREALYNEELFSLEDTIDGDDVRFSYLSILLRIGDLMDLEQSRTNNFALSFFANTYTVEALNHNIRHNHVTLFKYDSKKIQLNVKVENDEQLDIWNVWRTYLKEEIVNANTRLKEYNIFFPEPHIQINPADNFTMEEQKSQKISIADSKLVVVHSFIIGSELETCFKNTPVQLIPFEWDSSMLDACSQGRIDFCVYNKLSTISYIESHTNPNIEILGTIGHSMGGKNFSAVVHVGNKLLGKTISEIKTELHGCTIYVGKNNDRFRNLMCILDLDEKFLMNNNNIINIPDVTTEVLRNDPTAIVFGGQNLRLEAISMDEFTELIPFSTLDTEKQNKLKANSENVLIVNKSSKIKLKIAPDFMQKLLANFHRNGYNQTQLDELTDRLTNICSFVSNDYNERRRFVQHILYESYRFGNPVINQ